MNQVDDILDLSHDLLHKMKHILVALEEMEAVTGGGVEPLKDRIAVPAQEGLEHCSKVLEKYTRRACKSNDGLTEIYVAEFLQEITDSLKNHYGESVQFFIHCTPDLSEWVCEKRLYRVVFNLVKNAADAAIGNKADGSVSIFAHHRSSSLKIDIRDNGVGLDEYVVRQFAERAGEVKIDIGNEQGDGLPTVFALAHQMGGRLALKHTGREGSAFRLSIPSLIPQKNENRIMGI
ncbi:ATP-binding protein [Kordiimonas aquimaris]|uniref:ATP-binding protein n=1 Tax=Kordiimonas aquimaris TaxID=707591 RepID=UPI0021D060FA|nr:sensor histidine kinase [Kordiimonas aquimaris]